MRHIIVILLVLIFFLISDIAYSYSPIRGQKVDTWMMYENQGRILKILEFVFKIGLVVILISTGVLVFKKFFKK